MSEQDFFRSALSDFTYEAASGGAIRHLTDLGYTVKQISEKLTYPTPYERVRGTVWQQLLDTKVVLTHEPGSGRTCGKTEYAVEHDKYGRTSYRLLAASGEETRAIRWKVRSYSRQIDGSLAEYLAKMCERNGEEGAYIACDFGMWQRREPKKLEAAMQTLNERQREYISGLIWEDKVCYHRLNQRMREIMVKLYETGQYQGVVYFLQTEEKIEIN
ncbi:MAG: hypothetical protein K2J99_10640 [Lachnospiraceae bacterium]|nr:hypothetical protein [Lachnospiraceae bacterium]